MIFTVLEEGFLGLKRGATVTLNANVGKTKRLVKMEKIAKGKVRLDVPKPEPKPEPKPKPSAKPEIKKSEAKSSGSSDKKKTKKTTKK